MKLPAFPWKTARAERDALRAEVEQLRQQIYSHVCARAHWYPTAGAAGCAGLGSLYYQWPAAGQAPIQINQSPLVPAAAANPVPQVWNYPLAT